MKAPTIRDSAVNTEKAVAACACSAASVETVAALAVDSGTAVTAAAARPKKVATRKVADAHTKKPGAVSLKTTSSVLASALGGYLTGRLRTKWLEITEWLTAALGIACGQSDRGIPDIHVHHASRHLGVYWLETAYSRLNAKFRKAEDERT